MLIIGFAAVAVPMTDPVFRLSDEVRERGPIVRTAESALTARTETPLPAELGVAAPQPAPDAAPAQAEPPLSALAIAPPLPDEADAHVWAYLVETAPARETALDLDRAARVEIQRRLALLGYDPQGIDGVFGPRTRAAITAWQRDFGFVETGHVDAAVVASIEERSVETWAAWEAERARQVRHAARRAPVAPESSAEPAERADCVRGEDGRIIERQSFGCDLKGVKEGFIRLFAKGGAAPGGGPVELPDPGVER